MADENLGRFLKVLFRSAREIFNEEPVDGEALQTICQELLLEPRIPLHWRVCIHMMLAHISEAPDAEIDLAMDYLEQLEKEVNGGQMSEEKTAKWRDYVNTNRPGLLRLRKELSKAQTSDGEGQVGDDEKKADDENDQETETKVDKTDIDSET